MDLATHFEIWQHTQDAPASAAHCYLLDRDFCVVSAHTYEENVENPPVGTSFFEIFPAKRAVREELTAYVRSFPQKMHLTLCGHTPVLMMGTITAHTGLLPVFVPDGAVKSTLSFPAAFHHVLAHVEVSASAQMRYKEHGEETFAAACRWLLSVCAPFACSANGEGELASALSFCATRLSALLKVAISCDFLGVGARSCAELDMSFAAGVMLAVFAAARRSDAVSGVHLYAAMEGPPTLYLDYVQQEPAALVPELAPVLFCAAARGIDLDAVCPKDEPCRVQIRVSLGIAELSAQGVRERHRFLEGKRILCELPEARVAPVPFPELSFE